jgi:hypothetical protein
MGQSESPSLNALLALLEELVQFCQGPNPK